MYDLVNHDQSSETIVEVVENNLQIKAYKPQAASTELKMNYGLRTHVDYLIHNGFVPEQKMTMYVLDLGISPSDPKFDEKVKRLGGVKKHTFECRLGKLHETILLLEFLKIFLGTESMDEIWKFLNVRFAILSKGVCSSLRALLKNSDKTTPDFVANLVRLLRSEECLLSELSVEATTLSQSRNIVD